MLETKAAVEADSRISSVFKFAVESGAKDKQRRML